jgi:hypothetical protein
VALCPGSAVTKRGDGSRHLPLGGAPELFVKDAADDIGDVETDGGHLTRDQKRGRHDHRLRHELPARRNRQADREAEHDRARRLVDSAAAFDRQAAEDRFASLQPIGHRGAQEQGIASCLNLERAAAGRIAHLDALVVPPLAVAANLRGNALLNLSEQGCQRDSHGDLDD